jgi:signal transduction histidine kinase
MGGLGIVYGLAMWLVASNSNWAVTEALRLRFENRELLEQLTAAQVSLEETNQTLEQRVAERGAALERQTEALRDAQRMESVGLLAGGVAHDFNNLLTVVLGSVELLLADSRNPEDRARLAEIKSAANRGATLVSQLLAFSRRQVMLRKVLDLNAVVSDVRPLLTHLIGEHIELVVSLVRTPLHVEADPTQLQQTIINLATNARDAMPDGGTLTIATEFIDGVPTGATSRSASETPASGWTRRPSDWRLIPSSRPRMSAGAPASDSRACTGSWSRAAVTCTWTRSRGVAAVSASSSRA